MVYRDAKWPIFSIRFRDVHPTDWHGFKDFGLELFSEGCKVSLDVPNELPRSKLRGIKPKTQHPQPEKLRTTPTGPLDDVVAYRPFRFLDF
jgi:hypothetical protein